MPQTNRQQTIKEQVRQHLYLQYANIEDTDVVPSASMNPRIYHPIA